MEVKTWVVRSDVNVRPSWLKLARIARIARIESESYVYDVTDDESQAHQFSEFDDAKLVANVWSDVPGVWSVERVGA